MNHHYLFYFIYLSHNPKWYDPGMFWQWSSYRASECLLLKDCAQGFQMFAVRYLYSYEEKKKKLDNK